MSSLIQKYIPRTLNQMIGQTKIRKVIYKYLEANDLNSIPHLLFSGRAGVGKTTLANIIAKHFYGDNIYGNFFEFNASDDRGIDFVRNNIKEIVSKKSIINTRKIILLDEMDNLTKDAQDSLKRIMEKYQGNVLFILTCNTPSKIIEPLFSRCTSFEFEAISDDLLEKYLIKICDFEKIQYKDDDIKYIISSSNRDVRKSINNLEKLKNGESLEILPENILELSTSEYLRLLTRLDAETIMNLLVEECLKKEMYHKIEVIGLIDYRLAVGATKSRQLLQLFMELKK